jgi:hypothetical protein
MPYAPNPGTYTQLWTSQSATSTAAELAEDMESYINTYLEAAPNYAAIQTTILNSLDWMGFLTVLAGNQVVLVHSLGLFSSGLGRPTPAHNRIFGLLGEKVARPATNRNGTISRPNVMDQGAKAIPAKGRRSKVA